LPVVTINEYLHVGQRYDDLSVEERNEQSRLNCKECIIEVMSITLSLVFCTSKSDFFSSMLSAFINTTRYLLQTSDSIGRKCGVLPEVSIEGPYIITEVGMYSTDLTSNQIRSADNRLLINLSHISAGLVKLKPEGIQQIEKASFVGMEFSNPDLMEVTNNLYEFMASCYSSRSSIHRFQIFIRLLITVLRRMNATLYSQRFNTRCRIQNQKKGYSFDRDPFLRENLSMV